MKAKVIPFEKFEGAGNDFIIFDFFEFEFIDLNEQAVLERMCDRHFGIGADGIIAVCPDPNYDFRMKYLNSDGRFSTFCGNGSRCAVLYVCNKLNKTKLHFIAADGEHTGELIDDVVRIKMSDIDQLIETPFGPFVQSGSPHIMIEVNDPFHYNIYEEGKKIRNAFSPEGSNVNFIEWKDDQLWIATYERGVENETLACGTGITASAYNQAVLLKLEGHISIPVISKGGALKVDMNLQGQKATEIYLTGPAHHVYAGFYKITN
ncbi:MAG: diaminopimelate epimerase [Saprospiraceae bacterium]|nr:diaminopimelate epimerase [Candidatus Defluviibacterium haderslevense]MBK7244625.1 diaminopimelate epimerase [Candidatus Defluviibacterium haderslevense]